MFPDELARVPDDYYMWDEDPWDDEPQEYTQMIDELKSSLRESVRQEIKDEIASLRKKLGELTDVQNNWSEKLRELEDEKFKYQEAARNAKFEANKAKLSELMESIGHEAWTVTGHCEYIKPKCDKCDKDRKFHYKSPMGRDMTEDCECARRKYIYEAKPIILYKIHQRIKSNGKPQENPWLYYAYHESGGFFPGEKDEDIELIQIRLGETERRDRYNAYFLDENAAKAYAAELNEDSKEW